MKDADYYAENPEEFEELTEDQQEAIFNGESIDQGDTKAVEGAGEDVESEVQTSTEEPEEESTEETSEAPDAGEESEPELLAKDGKHTIPYAELVEAREQAARLEVIAEQQQKLIEELQAAKIKDDETGGTEAQEAVLEAYDGDFPEIAEDMKPYIQKMIDEGVKSKVTSIEQQSIEEVKKLQDAVQSLIQERHVNAILNAHSDASEIVQSKELQTWIDGQPSFVRDQYATVLQQGTSDQFIELISAFKEATNISESKKPAESQETIEEKAKKAKDILANTKQGVPSSLSDIPAGEARAHDEVEAMLNMTPRQLEQKFEGKSPEEIQKLMSKLV